MAQTGVLNIDDKRLRMAEEGLTQEVPCVRFSEAPIAVPAPKGLGNPAPLGLLCFGMTTGMSVGTLWEFSAQYFNSDTSWA